ncbi:HlyD family secretion protein [Dongshaea marina]|uniref:HlyD family secretion protein n=1 Tax=Dongshaea marina TaxID=2047966 RepID=UPI00131EF1D3|nr:HlyD family efflux transporter periplasmic adaptor subunit [Dongshaea marina]
MALLASLLTGCGTGQPSAQGYVEADLTYVSSPVSGQLTALPAVKGELVKAGQTLFELDSQPLHYKQQEALAKLAQAQATLRDLKASKRAPEIANLRAQLNESQAKARYDQANYQRAKSMYQRKLISFQEYQQQQSAAEQSQAAVAALKAQLKLSEQAVGRQGQLQSAQASVKVAQSEVKQASWDLAQSQIQSPDNGFIYDRYYQRGEQVQAYSPVVSVLVPSQIKLIFYVPETELSDLQLGEAVHFRIDHSHKDYLAHVSYISPKAEYTPPVIYSEQTRSSLVYRIEAKPVLTKEQSWHPGQPISVIL